MVNPWFKAAQQTSRVVVSNDNKNYVLKRIQEHEKKGYVTITEIIEDIDFNGRVRYVCVMENPILKAKRNPSN